MWPIFFYPVLAIFFSIAGQRQLIRTGPSVCCVPVLISGNAVRVGSSNEPRIRSPDCCHLISPDPDLGPDPRCVDPDSLWTWGGKNFDFKQIFIFKPDFGPVVVFLGLSPPSWASHVIRMRCPDDSDQSGKVQIRVLDSDPDTQQLYFWWQTANFLCMIYNVFSPTVVMNVWLI